MSKQIQHNHHFLPTSKDEMNLLGWEQADIIFVSGDAYIDHPSFGLAIIARLAEKAGLKVAIIPQPNWRDDLRDFKKLGTPKYFFGVTAGAMDSMVNHYTALKRKRSDDAFTPGGKAGFRPDYASIVYTKILKSLYPNSFVILGGIEASLRRITHYDYWSDSVKPSVLIESGADLLLYGMAEQAFEQLIELCVKGKLQHSSVHQIPQTSFIINNKKELPEAIQNETILLPSHEECAKSKKVFAKAFKLFEENSNSYQPRTIMQAVKEKHIVINAPFPLAKNGQTDVYYALPYTRLPHHRYNKKEPIPAYEMIAHSVTSHRGCFGGCSFCAINAHQGKFVVSRTKESILCELHQISNHVSFRGHISDIGGPTANMYNMSGINTDICEKCKRPSCLFPHICNNLNFNHAPMIDLYKDTLQIPRISLLTIGSGLRYDMLVQKNKDQEYKLSEYTALLVSRHVSGRLKVAPEHVSENVLKLMRKPSFILLKQFSKIFRNLNREFEKKQQLVLYLIAGHPGCTKEDMQTLSNNTKHPDFFTDPVQEFTPTPLTLSTTIYYTGINPYTGETINVIKQAEQVRKQKNTIKPTNTSFNKHKKSKEHLKTQKKRK